VSTYLGEVQQRVEAALANETAARAQTERALVEARAGVRDLQTKIGHADLAKNEAQDALRREREAIAGLRQELEAVRANAEAMRRRGAAAERCITNHEDLIAEERQARRSLEKSLRAAEAARDEAERLLRTLSEHAPQPVAQVLLSHDHSQAPVVSGPRTRGRPAVTRQPTLPELEPEPVKWWLMPPKAASRR
jgi:chromosome segregation ATPase